MDTTIPALADLACDNDELHRRRRDANEDLAATARVFARDIKAGVDESRDYWESRLIAEVERYDRITGECRRRTDAYYLARPAAIR